MASLVCHSILFCFHDACGVLVWPVLEGSGHVSWKFGSGTIGTVLQSNTDSALPDDFRSRVMQTPVFVLGLGNCLCLEARVSPLSVFDWHALRVSGTISHRDTTVFPTGIVPPYALEVEIQWKEDSSESDWVNI